MQTERQEDAKYKKEASSGIWWLSENSCAQAIQIHFLMPKHVRYMFTCTYTYAKFANDVWVHKPQFSTGQILWETTELKNIFLERIL